MRIYDFPSVRVYELLYEGLCTTLTKGPETRAVGRVMKNLEKIGIPKKKKDESGRVLDEDSLLYTIAECIPVEIQDADHEIVKKLINAVEWNGVGAANATDLMDWLDLIQTKDQIEAKKRDLENGILKPEPLQLKP